MSPNLTTPKDIASTAFFPYVPSCLPKLMSHLVEFQFCSLWQITQPLKPFSVTLKTQHSPFGRHCSTLEWRCYDLLCMVNLVRMARHQQTGPRPCWRSMELHPTPFQANHSCGVALETRLFTRLWCFAILRRLVPRRIRANGASLGIG